MGSRVAEILITTHRHVSRHWRLVSYKLSVASAVPFTFHGELAKRSIWFHFVVGSKVRYRGLFGIIGKVTLSVKTLNTYNDMNL